MQRVHGETRSTCTHIKVVSFPFTEPENAHILTMFVIMWPQHWIPY